MADSEELAVDPDGTRWWDEVVARTLQGFERADRSRLDDLLGSTVDHQIDPQKSESGRPDPPER